LDFINTALMGGNYTWSSISNIVIPGILAPAFCGVIPNGGTNSSSFSSSCACGSTSSGQMCTLTCNTPGFEGNVTRTCTSAGWDSLIEPSCTSVSYVNFTWPFHIPGDYPDGWAVATTPNWTATSADFSITYDFNCCCNSITDRSHSPGCLTTETPCSNRGNIPVSRILRSPAFVLRPGNINFVLYGFSGSDRSTTFADPLNPPADWIGIAVRNASSGQYVAAATKSCVGTNIPELGVIAASVLLPFVGSTVTLDFVNTVAPGGNWGSISDVVIPGVKPASNHAYSARTNWITLLGLAFVLCLSCP